jgi:hypothetical protein
MNYSVNKLATAAECDSVLAIINQEKSDLQYKKNLHDHRLELISKSSTEIAAEMVILDSKIAGYESIAQTIPDGDAKNENAIDLENAKHRKFLLNSRLAEQGSVALLGIEIDKAQLDAQTLQVDDAFTAVNTRKAAL